MLPLIRLSLMLLMAALMISTVAESTAEHELKVPPKPSRKNFPVSTTSLAAAASDDDEGLMNIENIIESASDLPQMKATGSEPASVSQPIMNKQRPLVQFEPTGGKVQSKELSIAESKPKSEYGRKSLMSSRFLKDTMKSAYKTTKKAIKDASDSIELFKAKTRLSLAIDDAHEDSKALRKEYSLFTVTLSPVIESSLNYIGDKNLHNLEWDPKDEFDFRMDALHALAFSYEFVRLLNAWRESLLPVHEAYQNYLQTMRNNLLADAASQTKIQTLVDDRLFVQLKTIHNYLLLTAWLTFDELSKEPRDKLEYLMRKLDTDGSGKGKDFERSYLRQVLSLVRIFEKTRDRFDAERKHVIDSLAAVGAQDDSYPDVDEFFERFRDALDRGQLPEVEWRVPQQMEDFLQRLEPQIRLNPLVYDKHFLWRLNKGL